MSVGSMHRMHIDSVSCMSISSVSCTFIGFVHNIAIAAIWFLYALPEDARLDIMRQDVFNVINDVIPISAAKVVRSDTSSLEFVLRPRFNICINLSLRLSKSILWLGVLYPSVGGISPASRAPVTLGYWKCARAF
jgi:hypothetical protein